MKINIPQPDGSTREFWTDDYLMAAEINYHHDNALARQARCLGRLFEHLIHKQLITAPEIAKVLTDEDVPGATLEGESDCASDPTVTASASLLIWNEEGTDAIRANGKSKIFSILSDSIYLGCHWLRWRAASTQGKGWEKLFDDMQEAKADAERMEAADRAELESSVLKSSPILTLSELQVIASNPSVPTATESGKHRIDLIRGSAGIPIDLTARQVGDGWRWVASVEVDLSPVTTGFKTCLASKEIAIQALGASLRSDDRFVVGVDPAREESLHSSPPYESPSPNETFAEVEARHARNKELAKASEERLTGKSAASNCTIEENDLCPKCPNGNMKPSKAIIGTGYIDGHSLPPGIPATLLPCLKCDNCGFSVTVPATKHPTALAYVLEKQAEHEIGLLSCGLCHCETPELVCISANERQVVCKLCETRLELGKLSREDWNAMEDAENQMAEAGRIARQKPFNKPAIYHLIGKLGALAASDKEPSAEVMALIESEGWKGL